MGSCAIVPTAILVACGSDSGPALHGPQFGLLDDAAPNDAAPSLDDADLSPTDSAKFDAPHDADAGQPPCDAGAVVVLAGDDTTLTGAAQIHGAAWTSGAIAGGAAKNHPSIAAFGDGFLALTRGPDDALQSVTFATSWSAATAIGAAKTIGAPALAVVGARAHTAYLAPGAPSLFFRAENAGSSWNVTADPITSGAVQSFGRSAGALAAPGAELVFAQTGGDNDGLYVQSYDGAWSVGTPIFNAGTLWTAPPAVVATSGSFDAVVLYADNTPNHVIGFTTRQTTTKTWSAAAVTHADAQTAEQPQLVALSSTTLLAVFRGNNQRPYVMLGTTRASAIEWSAPAPLLADASTVDGPPSVAKGVCGDDAVVVFASSAQVHATRYRAGRWSAAEPIPGASGTRVAVATR